MRVALGGISHETSTFSAKMTETADFDLSLGAAIVERFQNTLTPIGGFLDAAAARRWEVIPTLVGIAVPGGVVSRATFTSLLNGLLDGLRAAGPIDAVLLRQHGALVADGYRDGDAAVLAAVREVVGPDLPVLATLDLHANISIAMVREASLLVGYDTYPHVDGYERAVEAVGWLERIQSGRSFAALGKPRVLAALPKMFTESEPMQSIMTRVHELERQTDSLITVAGGFPYADVPEAGFGVLAYSDTKETAELIAGEITSLIEQRAAEFDMRGIPVADAVEAAVRHRGSGAIVLADIADNPGAGTPCDGTVLLNAILEKNIPGTLVLTICDPEAVAEAVRAGPGSTISVNLGGHSDHNHGEPLPIETQVQALTDGQYVHRGPMSTGLVASMGRTALLRVKQVLVAVTEKRSQPLDLGMVYSLGIQPESVRVFVLKSSVHFRAAFTPLADRILEVGSMGISNPDYQQFQYTAVCRPIHPLDALPSSRASGVTQSIEEGGSW